MNWLRRVQTTQEGVPPTVHPEERRRSGDRMTASDRSRDGVDQAITA